ncbi:MAG: hypothetical protein NZT92_06815 [Abditibacteriales bacterium]|nr:hypothetical protein [Abditibacteriales bacterium]MDW8365651.1 hypothetical protein [Abditibacteriales bacterium]
MRIDYERLQSFSAEPLIALEEQMENAVRQERIERRRLMEERKAKKRRKKKKRRGQGQ